MRLRPARESDSHFLFELHRVALGPVIEATWGPWDDAVQRRFHEAWFDPTRVAIVVCDGQDVGVWDVEERDHGTMYLARVELLPEFQSRGIGTKLVRELAERAESLAAPAIELDVLQANEAGRRLYERLGFRVVDEAPPKQRMRADLTRR